MFARIDFNRVTAVVALLLVAALVTSCCSTWKTQKSSARDVLLAQGARNKPPDKMRVQASSGAKTVVFHPALRGDSLVGLIDTEVATTVTDGWNGPRSARSTWERRQTAIPLDSIRTVDLRGTSTLKTLGLWAIILGSAAALTANVAANTPGEPLLY